MGNSVALETPGASFECNGPNCKAFAPEPFINPLLPPTVAPTVPAPTPRPVVPPTRQPTLPRFVPSPVPIVRRVPTARPVRVIQPPPANVQPINPNPVFDVSTVVRLRYLISVHGKVVVGD